MVIELKGQQLRIRVKNPNRFIRNSFRTQVLSERLQRVAGRLKSSGKFATQSWRLNLSAYRRLVDVIDDLDKKLYKKQIVTRHETVRAIDLAQSWFEKNRWR